MKKIINWIKYKYRSNILFNRIDIKSYWEFRKLDDILVFILGVIFLISLTTVIIFGIVYAAY